MKVEVVRSPRRRKTVQAREFNGVLRVSIPATMTKADEERWVAEMLRRMARRAGTGAVDLAERAEILARRYRLLLPVSITWAANQEWRWGSCTPSAGTIRISSRLAREPGWVLDYVLVHELAHLEVARHDRQFWSIVNRYPLAERARGFLIARGLEPPMAAPQPTPADVAPASSTVQRRTTRPAAPRPAPRKSAAASARSQGSRG